MRCVCARRTDEAKCLSIVAVVRERAAMGDRAPLDGRVVGLVRFVADVEAAVVAYRGLERYVIFHGQRRH